MRFYPSLRSSGVKAFLISCLFVFSFSVRAELLTQVLPELMVIDFDIRQSEDILESAKYGVSVKEAAWFPKVDIMMSEGYEYLYQSTFTRWMRREWKASLNFLIYDFGATSSAVVAARKAYQKKSIDLVGKKQQTLYDGISTYLQLLKNREKLRYGKRSESNIKKQTGMEESRVAQGSGFSSDVLQAKSKLASANARVARAEGELAKAFNNYRALYQRAPRNLNGFRKPQYPRRAIPKTLDEALDIARDMSPKILATTYDVEVAQANITAERAKFMPKLEWKTDVKHKHRDAGLPGVKEELKSHIELNWSIFAGGADSAGLKRSVADLSTKKDISLDTLRDVEKAVKNAWQDLVTDQINAGFLRNSANISAEFLTMARKERKLGRRSLVAVLTEENNYITALESAVTAEISAMVSGFRLLKEMGILNISMVNEVAMKQASLPNQ